MSDNSVGKRRFQMLYANARQNWSVAGVMEKASGFKADSNFAFASPLVSMRL